MKFAPLLLFFVLFLKSLSAQSQNAHGFVIDKDSKARLAKVYIYNSSNDEAIYNNAKGEFVIKSKPGDTLFAALPGYMMDTAIYTGTNAVVFQLKSLSIALKQVEIFGKKISPKDQYEKNLKDYKYLLDLGSSKDLLNMSNGGVGLGIDAIYNLLSRQGRNARHLQSILEKDYREAIIDYRYSPEYVSSVLSNKNIDIKDFMSQYRPTYQFVLTANDYDFVQFIQKSYQSYQRNPAAFRLPKLPKLDTKN